MAYQSRTGSRYLAHVSSRISAYPLNRCQRTRGSQNQKCFCVNSTLGVSTNGLSGSDDGELLIVVAFAIKLQETSLVKFLLLEVDQRGQRVCVYPCCQDWEIWQACLLVCFQSFQAHHILVQSIHRRRRAFAMLFALAAPILNTYELDSGPSHLTKRSSCSKSETCKSVTQFPNEIGFRSVTRLIQARY